MWFETWPFYSHMPACAWRTSQKADVLLWNTYSLSIGVQVWSLCLYSPNTHLKYCYRCPKPKNWIYILCSPTEATFTSVCYLWSLTSIVVLHQNRTGKSVSYPKSLRSHQKEKDHSATESNWSGSKLGRKDMSLGAFKATVSPQWFYKEFMHLFTLWGNLHHPPKI